MDATMRGWILLCHTKCPHLTDCYWICVYCSAAAQLLDLWIPGCDGRPWYFIHVQIPAACTVYLHTICLLVKTIDLILRCWPVLYTGFYLYLYLHFMMYTVLYMPLYEFRLWITSVCSIFIHFTWLWHFVQDFTVITHSVLCQLWMTHTVRWDITVLPVRVTLLSIPVIPVL